LTFYYEAKIQLSSHQYQVRLKPNEQTLLICKHPANPNSSEPGEEIL
jgi:hypothetical protein